jgi:hypothetical protein
VPKIINQESLRALKRDAEALKVELEALKEAWEKEPYQVKQQALFVLISLKKKAYMKAYKKVYSIENQKRLNLKRDAEKAERQTSQLPDGWKLYGVDYYERSKDEISKADPDKIMKEPEMEERKKKILETNELNRKELKRKILERKKLKGIEMEGTELEWEGTELEMEELKRKELETKELNRKELKRKILERNELKGKELEEKEIEREELAKECPKPSEDPVRWKRINDAVNAKLARDYPNPQPRHPTVSPYDVLPELLPGPSPIQGVNSNLGANVVANPFEEVEEISVISPIVYNHYHNRSPHLLFTSETPQQAKPLTPSQWTEAVSFLYPEEEPDYSSYPDFYKF